MTRRSLIFRYTLLYAMVFGLVVAGVLGGLYWSTISAHEEQLDEEIETETNQLKQRLVGLTVSQMAAVVTKSSGDTPGQSTIYMLATQTRQYVAGNLQEWPRGVEGDEKLHEFPLAEGEEPSARARARAVTLPAGERLLVGRNLAEQERFRGLIGWAFLATLVSTVLVGVSGGFVISRRVSRRLDEINQNSVAILEGDLERRMPESGRGDEFDTLAGNLNRMLDRIGSLMHAMREVTDDIAHDMRGPISRLRSRIEVALLAPPNTEAYREALQQTIRDADEILAMFNALLTIAHTESGEPRRSFEPVDLSGLAAKAVEIYEPAAEDAGLTLLLEGEPDVRLMGNVQLLNQAIANLLDNAIKYVPRGGHVALRVRKNDARARLEVADDGPGIPAEFRERAFDRFSRLEASRTSPGQGLGLSLVRAVARLHEGSIAIEDNHPGFKVLLELPALDR